MTRVPSEMSGNEQPPDGANAAVAPNQEGLEGGGNPDPIAVGAVIASRLLDGPATADAVTPAQSAPIQEGTTKGEYTAEEEAQIEKIVNDFERQLRWSFELSQGLIVLQNFIYSYLATYAWHNTPESRAELLNEAINRFASGRPQVILPRGHKPIGDTDATDQYVEQQAAFVDHLRIGDERRRMALYEGGEPLSDKLALYERIVTRSLLGRDATLVYRGRGQSNAATSRRDPYDSRVRSMILPGRIHGSPAVESLGKAVRSRILEIAEQQDGRADDLLGLATLVWLWEIRHPGGEGFWSGMPEIQAKAEGWGISEQDMRAAAAGLRAYDEEKNPDVWAGVEPV